MATIGPVAGWTAEEARALTLRAVNTARAVVGFSPLADMPPGKRDDCEECPVAVALGDLAAWFSGGIEVHAFHRCHVEVDGQKAEFYLTKRGAGDVTTLRRDVLEEIARGLGGEWNSSERGDFAWIEFPDGVADFVMRFDAGEYPDLDLGARR